MPEISRVHISKDISLYTCIAFALAQLSFRLFLSHWLQVNGICIWKFLAWKSQHYIRLELPCVWVNGIICAEKPIISFSIHIWILNDKCAIFFLSLPHTWILPATFCHSRFFALNTYETCYCEAPIDDLGIMKLEIIWSRMRQKPHCRDFAYRINNSSKEKSPDQSQIL